MNSHTDYLYNSLPDKGKIMWDRVGRWHDQLCRGPDPRGPAPSFFSHRYCYFTLRWVGR